MKRRIISLMLLFVVVSSVFIVANASTIMPRLNNTFSTSTNFTISSSGNACISTTYNGYKGITTGATITSYIEKRTLGIFWTKVDIGQPNNEWIDTCNDYLGAFSHNYQLENTGTYRAIVTYEIRGTGGATDVINYEQERTYS